MLYIDVAPLLIFVNIAWGEMGIPVSFFCEVILLVLIIRVGGVGVGEIRTTIDIDKDLHAAIKIHCFKKGITFKAFVESALKKYVKEIKIK